MSPVGATVEGVGKVRAGPHSSLTPRASLSQSRASPMATRLGCSWLGKDSSTSYVEVPAESRPDSGSRQRCSSSCTSASSRGLEARCGSLESSLQCGQRQGQAQRHGGPLGNRGGAKTGLSPKILPDPTGIQLSHNGLEDLQVQVLGG